MATMTVEGAPGNMDTAELRRERKRQTDRLAQRQHRKRQKQYIEELEAQIALLKTPGPSETSQLAAQNIRLQDEVGLSFGAICLEESAKLENIAQTNA